MAIARRLGRLALAAASAIVVLAVALAPAAAQVGNQPAPGSVSAAPAVSSPVAIEAAIEGPIGPATVRHVERVIRRAADRHAEVLILRLDTPGGLAESMRSIIAAILASPVPVVGYVAPPGAHAASAGTYILYAAHVAAMAPGTNIGAATPVRIGGLPGLTPPGGTPPSAPAPGDGAARAPDGNPAAPLSGDAAMTAKVTNDAVAFIRSLAQLRGRNADWAERAVREAASLPADEALRQHVIDVVADDEAALLSAIDGREVRLPGATRRLATRGLPVETVGMDAITRLLGVLSNPDVALLLMMAGVYGILFEFWSPGAIAPGAIGAICLTLGLYALNQLPLDYAGLALIAIGISFMVAEAFAPSFGLLGAGGIVAFVLGAAMLVDTDVPAYRVSWPMIVTLALTSGAVLVLLIGYTLRAYRRAPGPGPARMLGVEGRVIDWSGEAGFVWAEGERWHATGASGLVPGGRVRVRDMRGLTLIVTQDNEGKT